MRLRLPVDSSLRDGLVTAFGDILAHAGAVTDDADAARAILEYRKAVRRARALLALCRPLLGGRPYRQLADELRDAHRLPSRLRDLDALPQRVRSLEVGRRARRALSAVEARLRERRVRVDPGLVEALLIEGAEATASIAVRFDAALPAELGRDDLLRGLRRSYRRARDAMHRARRSGDERDLHDWRKRTRALRYQLELLVGERGGDARRLRKAYGGLARELGALTDLLTLRAFLRADRTLAARGELEGLHARVEHLLDDHLRAAHELGDVLFADGPRHFATTVGAGWRRR